MRIPFTTPIGILDLWLQKVLYFTVCIITPVSHGNQRKSEFLYFIYQNKLWEYYSKLKEYKESPIGKGLLEKQFAKLFSQKTGYAELDNRIASTLKHKNKLLVVLDYPEIPLHNNDAEIALRDPVIRRDISHGTQSEEGKVAVENMHSLSDTCRKLGVSYYAYLKDRISGKNEIPPLAQIIAEKAAQCS